MSELQNLKALNKQIFKTPGGKEIKIKISDCGKEYCRLDFRYDSGVKLFPHVEPNNNICYVKPEGRYVKSLGQFDKAKRKAIELADKKYEEDELADEVCSELHTYFRDPTSQKLAFVPISLIPYKGMKCFFTNEDNLQFIPKKTGNLTKRIYATIKRIDIQQIINERKTDLDDIIRRFIKNTRENKLNIIEIHSERATSHFGFLRGKFYRIIDTSLATEFNSRTSAVDSNENISKSVLHDKKVLVIGVGAIGSHVAELISSMWPREIELVDFDTTNNNSSVRQNYSRSYLLSYKADNLKERLSKYGNVKVVANRINYKEILSGRMELQHDCDVIIDCTGEAMISSYPEITENLLKKDGHLLAAYLIGDKKVVKESNSSLFKTDILKTEWHQIDVDNDKLGKGKAIIKGCSPVLLYSYINVYEIAAAVADKVKKLYE